MPVGVARRAEPDPGLAWTGGCWRSASGQRCWSSRLLALLAAGPASRDRAPVANARDRPSPVARMRAVRAAGLAPTATIGVGLALDPRDGTRWSVRSALTGVTFGITGLVAVVVLAASLTTLLDAPDRYGTPWDSTIPGFGGEIVEQLRGPLLAEDDVERLGILQTSLGRVDGQETNLHAVEALKGPMGLTLLAGRMPTGPGEVVLGSTTLRAERRRDRIGRRDRGQDGPPGDRGGPGRLPRGRRAQLGGPRRPALVRRPGGRRPRWLAEPRPRHRLGRRRRCRRGQRRAERGRRGWRCRRRCCPRT